MKIYTNLLIDLINKIIKKWTSGYILQKRRFDLNIKYFGNYIFE